MTTPIQTVHGITHPVIAQNAEAESSGDESEPSTQQYREETAERLEHANARAERLQKPAVK